MAKLKNKIFFGLAESSQTKTEKAEMVARAICGLIFKNLLLV